MRIGRTRASRRFEMILVTGATGFIGSHVARYLAQRGEPLRLLVRKTSDRTLIQGLDAQICQGDLKDRTSLRQAVQGCDAVFHVAADYRLWTPDPQEVYATNVDGTRNLLEEARRAGVARFIYTSSIGTIAPSPDGDAVSEESISPFRRMVGHYKRSKFLAEREALHAAAAGLPVVVVNPTAPVGEGDIKPTPTGKIVQDFLKGRMPAYVDTGLNVVDVRDVACGHWLAASRGRVGERYLLGAENLTFRDILQELADISGRRAPRIRLPYSVAWTAGAACQAWSRLSGRPPAVPLEGVRIARYRMFADCSKARRELGFHPGPVRPALERAVEWFSERDPTDAN